MAMVGMDVEQVQSSLTQITSLTGQLQDTIAGLNKQVTGLSSIWQGADATKFVGTIWPQDKSNLDKCKADLDTLASELKKEIDQQNQASGS